jgi:hypothetical protein
MKPLFPIVTFILLNCSGIMGYGQLLKELQVDSIFHFKSGDEGWYGDQVVNPFISPGIRGAGTRDYYGSGDANGDGQVNNDDVEYLNSGGEINFRCDTNGDGIMGDQNDVRIILEFVEGIRPYMPSHWNYLNKLEKIDWFKKMVELDDTDVYKEGWYCGDYTNHFETRFAGFENAENYDGFDFHNNFHFNGHLLEENGKMNLPVYDITTKAGDGNYHGIIGILIGDDPLVFSDWCFIEPQTDGEVKPGMFSMRNQKGDRASFRRLAYTYNWIDNRMKHRNVPVLVYEFDENGEPILTWQHPHIITKHPGNPITEVHSLTYQSDLIKVIYPNPASDIVNVQYSILATESREILLLDELGRILETFNLMNPLNRQNTIHINISSYPPGMYFIKLDTQTEPFIISR